jgi:hypothetical protein
MAVAELVNNLVIDITTVTGKTVHINCKAVVAIDSMAIAIAMNLDIESIIATATDSQIVTTDHMDAIVVVDNSFENK